MRIHFSPSYKRITYIVFLVSAAILLFTGFGKYQPSFLPQSQQAPIERIIKKQSSEPAVIIENTYIPVEIAKTAQARQRGLSGRQTLAPQNGMLFIFEKPDIYRFWMPNMFFPIDIIWIDQNHTVTGISKNVLPERNPANPRFYVSPRLVQYVLEVNAGFAETEKVEKGNTVIFENIE